MQPGKRPYLFPLGVTVVVLVAATIGYLLTHGRSATKTPARKVRFATAIFTGSAQVYCALEKGYFREEGLDVSYLPTMTGAKALEAVVRGEADVGTVADAPFVLGVLRGNTKTRIIATLNYTPNYLAVVARRDKGISSPKDLRGKTIGTSRGTAAHFVLDSFLLYNHIPREDVRIVDVPIERVPEALKKGELQAATSWEPFLADAKAQLGANGVFFPANEQQIYKTPWNIAAMEDFVRRNPETITRLLRALLKADAFIQNNRAEARRITARYLGRKDTFDSFWEDYLPDVSLSPLLVENMENETRWAMENRLTDEKEMPDYLDYLYFQGLESVKPDAVTIPH